MNYRAKSFVSLLGDIRFERAYYHCAHCGEGHMPWDSILRLSPQRLTRAAAEVVTLAGIQDSFGKVADRMLWKQTGLRLSESTVERTTEAAGIRLGAMLDQGTVFGGKTPWDWHRDRSGRTCGYISVDATGIQMQGPDGAKAEGRMAYVGMIFNPQPRRDDDEALAKPCDGVRYLAGLYKLDDLGMQLRRQAAQVGLNEVEQWIALTDAGNGLENFMDVNFPRAVKIVDFRHVTEYLSALSKLLSEGEAAADLLDGWCHRLKHAGGSKVLEELQGLDRGAMTAACRVEHDRVLTYFGNHVGRMNYPEYLRQGWQIGSGAVESACKRVINARLNMGGMRWGEEGGDALAHLRALWCSDADQWDTFWSMAA